MSDGYGTDAVPTKWGTGEPYEVEQCQVCYAPVGHGERGPMSTCGRPACIDTRLHRMGQPHPTAECIECNS